MNDYYLDLEISGIMVLPCAVTLKPVNHDFNIKISDNLNELLSEIDKNIKKDLKIYLYFSYCMGKYIDGSSHASSKF